MESSIKDKIVDFEKYCKICKYADLHQDDDGNMPEPCNECLGGSTNEYSQRPIKWEEK